MYWTISSLDESLQLPLIRISEQRGLEAGAFFFHAEPQRALVAWVFPLLGALFGGGVFAVFWLPNNPLQWIGFSLYFALAVVTILTSIAYLVRVLVGNIKPIVYFLVTPKVFIQVDFEEGILQGHLLRDAVDFKDVDQYGPRFFKELPTADQTKFVGREYTFTFREGNATFLLRDSEEIAVLERVLEQARGGDVASDPSTTGSFGMELLPTTGGSARFPWLQRITRPHLWLAVAFLAALGLIPIALMMNAP